MKKIITTKQAPLPIGPYNQAVQAGPFLYCSGQIALNPETGLLENASLEAETVQVMKNIAAVLDAANYDWKHVVKTTIYLRDMADFETINKIYGSYFDEVDAPARETVAVLGLPKNVSIEISVVCYKESFA